MITHTAGFGDRTHDFVLADGRTIGYGLYGVDDGPLVVVLDGPGSRGLGRAMALPAVQLGIKLLVPDRPGFGRSTPTPRGSFAELASDLLALVDRLGFRRFGIVAQSGGTPYALALAGGAGDRATGVAFVGGLAPLHERHALANVTGPMRTVLLLARRAPWLLRPLVSGLARQNAKDPEAAARKYANSVPAADRLVLDDPTMWAIHATSSAEIVSCPAALAREVRMLVRPWGVDYDRVTAPVALWVGVPTTSLRGTTLSFSRRCGTSVTQRSRGSQRVRSWLVYRDPRGCLGWRKSTLCSGFCARSVSTPRGRRERLDRRARFEIASARRPVEHTASLRPAIVTSHESAATNGTATNGIWLVEPAPPGSPTATNGTATNA